MGKGDKLSRTNSFITSAFGTSFIILKSSGLMRINCRKNVEFGVKNPNSLGKQTVSMKLPSEKF
jgi:hypothetical protein